MKRETLQHPKTLDLASRLGVSRPEAIGYLMLLWDWTAQNAIAGDVGKWANGSIARGCDWMGDPDEFVNALVESRWLEQSEEHRLFIHDWAQHCENWVRAKAQKIGISLLGELKSRSFPCDLSNPIQSKTNTADATPQAAEVNEQHPQKSKNRNRFTKPTVEEVSAYCRERRNAVDPQAFCDHYESNGWKVGRSAMKDWRASIRTWERNTAFRDGPNVAHGTAKITPLAELKQNSIGMITPCQN